MSPNQNNKLKEIEKHMTDMPHCWCNPEKTVFPNGNMSIVHTGQCEGCREEAVVNVEDGVGEKLEHCQNCGLYQTIKD